MNETTSAGGAVNETLTGESFAGESFAGERHESMRALYRHPSNRVLAGVCGGVADWLGWDATVVRLLWVVLAFVTSGAGFLVYLVLALVLPVGTQAGGPLRRARVDTRLSAGKPLALILIALGVLWLLNNIGILPDLSNFVFGALRLFFWPVLLILIGWRILRALGVNLGVGDGAALRGRMAQWGEEVEDAARTFRSKAAARGEAGAQGEGAAQASANGLWRSGRDRVLLGVCGGIAERYHLDPVLVRLLWVVLTVATMGLGLFAYLLAALLLPVRGDQAVAASAPVDPNAVEEIKIETGAPVHF